MAKATAIITRELAGISRGLAELHTAGFWTVKASLANQLEEELLAGTVRPLPPEATDVGEWQHGWHYYASSASEHHFRENGVLAQSHASHLAQLQPLSGHGVPRSSDWARIPGASLLPPWLSNVCVCLSSSRRDVRVLWPERPVGQAQSRVSAVWQVEAASGAHGDHFGPGLS